MQRKIHWAEPSLTEEEVEAVREVVESGWIGGNGPITKKFAKDFARKVGAKYALPVCNGTCGLMLGLLALKEKTKLNCAVPTWTFIATANTAKLIADDVKLIDCNTSTHNILYKKIPKYSTTVIMPVDVGGLPVDYDEIMELPFPHYTFADSAESLGATYKGRKIGSIADIHLFSLHAAKIATSGEGGVLTTNNEELYDVMVSLNNQGFGKHRKRGEYHHERLGFNFRMTEMQAAIGLVQIRKLSKFLRKRKEFARIYKDIIGDKILYQEIPKDRNMAWFLFTIIVGKDIRDKVVEELFREGIEVRTWKPVHLQPPYRKDYNYLPNANWLYDRVINLPIHNALNEEDIKYIGETVKKIINNKTYMCGS